MISNMTILAWSRPLWSSTEKTDRYYTLFGITDDTNTGFFLKADDSSPFNWQITDGTTVIDIDNSNNYPHDSGEMLFHAVYVDNLSAKGYMKIGTPEPYAEEVLLDNPTSYWRLGETSNATFMDLLGVNNGTHTAAIVGHPSAINDINTSTGYNGENAYSTVSYDASLNTSEFSIEAWIYPRDNIGNKFVISSYSGSVANGFAIKRGSSGDNLWNFLIGNGTSSEIVAGGEATRAHWAHLIGTYDGTTQKLWVNGTLVDSQNVTFSPNSTNDFILGSNLSLSSFFDGLIDEISVYNYAMPENRVKAHYDAGRGSKLTESSSDTIGDFTPTRLHLGSNGTGEFWDGYIDKLIVFDRLLSNAEIDKFAVEGYSYPYDAIMVIDFEQNAAIIRGVSVPEDLVATDNLTISENVDKHKVTWQKELK